MISKFLCLSFCLFSTLSLCSQHTYWQQKVDYNMYVNIDVETHRFAGTQTLVYSNNSPDVITKVFYHLYFNAFQPGSMMDQRSQFLPDADPRVGARIGALAEHEEGRLHPLELLQDGQNVSFEESGTILEVTLATPLIPGSSTTLVMKFNGQVPVQIRRSGRDNAEGVAYSMSQWYPKLCEYDYRGWHANPYIGREYYGVWGDFNVTIDINKTYVVAATGQLQNAKDIGYGYSDRKKPKAKRGKVKWNFVAQNVHDFVWAADPDYKHVTFKSEKSPEMHFFFQPSEETEAWDRLPAIMADAFEFMNNKYGQYPFPVYSFIQGGDGGMEYPMATLITGNRNLNSLVGVSVHELFHSWYQMVLGTDEARFAWMDEGFTSYASGETMNYLNLKEKHGLGQVTPKEQLHRGTVRQFAGFTQSGLEEPLSIHSDHYNTNAAYGVGAYVKGAVFLSQIKYMIGTENFDKLMLDYFYTWKFKHPEPHHFLRIAEKIADIELDWFGQYFINTTHTVDYGIDSSWTGIGDMVTLNRIGRFPMPIDVRIDYADGSQTNHTIPLRIMRGAKKSDDGIQFIVEEDWPWTQESYNLKLPTNKQISKITVDGSQLLVDVNRANNKWER